MSLGCEELIEITELIAPPSQTSQTIKIGTMKHTSTDCMQGKELMTSLGMSGRGVGGPESSSWMMKDAALSSPSSLCALGKLQTHSGFGVSSQSIRFKMPMVRGFGPRPSIIKLRVDLRPGEH